MAEPALDGLIDALRRLPGVGQKSAQRFAYHLLQHDREGARRLARALDGAVERMHHCARCHTFTEAEQAIRSDPVVQTLMSQFKTARIVPGSIKPV